MNPIITEKEDGPDGEWEIISPFDDVYQMAILDRNSVAAKEAESAPNEDA